MGATHFSTSSSHVGSGTAWGNQIVSVAGDSEALGPKLEEQVSDSVITCLTGRASVLGISCLCGSKADAGVGGSTVMSKTGGILPHGCHLIPVSSSAG